MDERREIVTDDTYHNPPEYRRHCARDAEKLMLIGATRQEIALFLGVDVDTLERWAEEHKDFEWAIQTLPTNLFIHLWCNDYGLIKWLYDYRRGALN